MIALVVPVFNESPDFLARLAHPERLLVVVDNAPGQQLCLGLPEGRQSLDGCPLHVLHLPHNTGGVGAARAKGFELALSLYDAGEIASPWIHTTDADASLPDDYGQSLPETVGAAVYPFRFADIDPDYTEEYQFLTEMERDYIEGLARAGSPHAHNYYGSLLAIHADAYRASGGFGPLLKNEDWELLDRIPVVTQLQGQPVTLRGRVSPRGGLGGVLQQLKRLGPQRERLRIPAHRFDALAAHPQREEMTMTQTKRFVFQVVSA